MTTRFTVDISTSTGMRTGDWADGEEFSILPDGREGREQALARVRLTHPGPAGPAPARPAAAASRQITVAEVEERAARQRTAPHPVLELLSGAGEPLGTVQPEQPGPEPRTFRVVDEHGVPLCRITRSPSRVGRRAYWRIGFEDGRPPITGHRGTWPGWIGFALTFPIWLLFLTGSLLVTLFTLGEVAEFLVWGAPKRVTWRRRWAPPLVGNALDFRYLRTGYRWKESLLEPRIAYAQAALHYFRRMHKE